MKISALVILLLLHPVHVSLTGIDYVQETRTYNVFIKVYIDDLLSDMKRNFGNIDNIHDVENVEFSDYLNDRVQIIEDGKHLEMKILTSETDGIEQRFTLSARGNKRVENVTVVNRIMTRLYIDQANMILFRFKEIEDACKLTVTDTLRNYCLK